MAATASPKTGRHRSPPKEPAAGTAPARSNDREALAYSDAGVSFWIDR